ncbi:MFS transporter [Tenggerimyces flavus]|uniref:MFS transporter n=1 Tax=Tenggerimyces flavus TaxID=1708749 RepID=A0ABV7Y4G8_9ACTN|nr:MFS transporter [Tenggerimyces flavus]MBM7790357.1 MFS family permease [Tenggerimyces flavus]
MTGTSVLKLPSLRRLTTLLLLSATAEQFTLLALLWFVSHRGYPAAALGALVLCLQLPTVVMGPIAGRLLDRWSPARLMAWDNLLRAVLLATIAGLHALSLLSLPVLLGVAVLVGALAPVTFAGVRVAVPRLVGERDLAPANGLLSVGDQLPLLVGPAAAGALLTVLDGPTALLLPAAALIAAGLLARRLGELQVPPSDRRGSANGFQLIWRTPAVRALYLLSVVYFFAYGPLEPALPLFAQDVLAVGPAGYGALTSAIGAGAMVGLLFVRPLSRLRPGIVNACGAIAWGIVLFPVVFLHDLVPAIAVLFVAGMMWAPYVAIEATVIQRLVPIERHGEVFGARRALVVGASPAGAALGGALLGVLPSTTVIGASALATVVAGLACLGSPSLRAVRA